MFCTKCGGQLREGAQYCSSCGKEVRNPPTEHIKALNEEAVSDEKPKSRKKHQKELLLIKYGLTECISCGHVLSLGAEACPNCGLKTELGRNWERQKELSRELESKRAEVSHELKLRRLLTLIILLICAAELTYGYCLTFEDRWVSELTTRAVLGYFLSINSIICVIGTLASYVIRALNLKDEIEALEIKEERSRFLYGAEGEENGDDR